MSRAVVTIRSQADRDRVAKWAAQVPAGSRIEFKSPRRSVPQSDLMWTLLTKLSQHLPWYGQKLTPDDWKDVLTASLRKCHVVPGIDAGSFVPLGMRTSDMSKAEMSALIELIYAFAAERGVELGEE